MHKDRITTHEASKPRHDKAYILYWMQSAQRCHENPALDAAIKASLRQKKPLRVLFVLDPSFKEANHRHYSFMLEGLPSLRDKLRAMNIEFFLDIGPFVETVIKHLSRAVLFIFDKAYTRPLRDTRGHIVQAAKTQHCPAYEIETELIVPIEKASSKCEYAARTLRPKLLRQVDDYLEETVLQEAHHPPLDEPSYADDCISSWLERINPDTSIRKSTYFEGGEDVGLERLEQFVSESLCHYDQSNDPALDLTSRLSPYLHFGQVSVVRIYQRVASMIDHCPAAVESYLEQLLVRRELAFNYVYYCQGYDQFETMTDRWAYETMAAHADDPRPVIYTKEDYIQFNTHDPYFNAAMKEMVYTGHMHNYMRMYWGKKIIEWNPDMKTAYETILSLNNAYFIDGRDPNSYTGVAWLFGRHDRAWTRRDIFGSLRYMNAAGLKRKFDIETYVKRMDNLEEKKS